MTETVRVRGCACAFPEGVRSLEDVFAGEGLDRDGANGLGIDRVSVRAGEKGSELAAEAGRRALAEAGIEPAGLGVILDCTTSPQELLAPAWNMSNKLQHDLGAKGAFTIGLAGAGATGLLVAIDFATSLLTTDESLSSALIVASETPVPAHRVLDPDDPVTVLGDGAGALVLSRGDEGPEVLGTALATEGTAHDACYIPGGAMKHPLREDLYRPVLDRPTYESARRGARVVPLVEQLCERHGVDRATIARLVVPNYSSEADAALAAGLELTPPAGAADNRRNHGHVQATDLVLNFDSARAESASGDLVLLASHGMGYAAGATLVRC